jgi:hypothetical protein
MAPLEMRPAVGTPRVTEAAAPLVSQADAAVDGVSVGGRILYPGPEGSMEAPILDRTARSAEKIAQWRKVGFKKIPWRKPGRFERFALPFDINGADHFKAMQ